MDIYPRYASRRSVGEKFRLDLYCMGESTVNQVGTQAATDIYGQLRYADSPWLVYWELTGACDLACRHCRAEAIPQRHPDELETAPEPEPNDRVTA